MRKVLSIVRRWNLKKRENIKKETKGVEKELGMEMIQVAILIAIAIILGFIFKTEITDFVNKTFRNLNEGF